MNKIWYVHKDTTTGKQLTLTAFDAPPPQPVQNREMVQIQYTRPFEMVQIMHLTRAEALVLSIQLGRFAAYCEGLEDLQEIEL